MSNEQPVPKNYIPTGQEDNSSQVPGQVAGGVGALALGAGAIAGGRAFFNPWLAKQQLLKSAGPFRQRYMIDPGVPVESLEGQLARRSTQLNTINTQQGKIHGNVMQKFDAGTNQNINDAADNLANNYPAWRRSVSTDYGNQLNGLQDRIAKMGVTFDADSFNKNVIQKTADSLAARGMDTQADRLRAYASSRESGILQEDGTPNTKPLSFADAKQVIAGQFKNDPAASMELKSNWINELNNHPALSQVPGLSTDLQALNTKYAQTAKVNNYIYQKKIVDPKSGIFNTEPAVKEMQDYVKGTGNPNLTAALKTMGEDTPLGDPIPGATAHANQLDNLATQRAQIIAKHGDDTALRASQIEALAPAQTQAKLMADQLKGLDNQIATREKITKGVGLIAGAGTWAGKALGVFGAAPQLANVAQAYQAAQSRPNANMLQSVGDMLYNSQTGNNLYAVQQAAQKALGYGSTTQADMDTLRKAGVTQQDLDMARKTFGVT